MAALCFFSGIAMQIDELQNKYTGNAIIVGSSPCLYDDYSEATKHIKGATVFALNDAAQAIHADFLVTLHPETMETFRKNSLNKNITTLSGQRSKVKYDVDHWFTNCSSGGTSAGSAIKIAIAMGFTQIILCGCPLIGGDGYFVDINSSNMPADKRVGLMPGTHQAHKTHLNNLRHESKRYPEGVTVRSMSGNTADIFGKPEFMEAIQ